MPELIRYPCGDYLPGQLPTPPSQTSNNLPSLLIPSPGNESDPFSVPPDTPPPNNSSIRYACIRNPNEFLNLGLLSAKCLPCDNNTARSSTGESLGLPSNDGRCIYRSLDDCRRNCTGRRIDTPDGEPVGNADPRGGNGGGGDGGGGDSGGTGSRNYNKCSKLEEFFCPAPQQNTPRLIRRGLIPCTQSEYNASLPQAAFINLSNPYDVRADGLCLDLPQNSSFFGGCVDTSNICIPLTGPRGRLQLDGLETPSTNSRGPTVNSSVSLSENLRQSVSNPNTLANSIINSIPKKPSTILSDFYDSDLRGYASVSSYGNNNFSLFDATYNFFKTTPNQNVSLVSNFEYLNIFKDTVAAEVGYFLRRKNSVLPWHEQAFKDLTEQKIILSINENLLTVFNNIHNVNNVKVNPSYFYNIIKRHLIAGTLDEFDPGYYTNVYNSQLYDEIVEVPRAGETADSIKLSLGIFQQRSVCPDFLQYPEISTRNDYKRMRFPLEDIEASITTKDISGNYESLYLANAGIFCLQLSGQENYLDIGDGAGYYISSTFLRNRGGDLNMPLPTQNVLPSCNYLPPIQRANVLDILGSTTDVVITVSSTSAHELSQDYNPSGDLTPMYFKIRLEDISDLNNPNTVINQISASYIRISDEEAISHSRNYSFNIVKVNLDYRDPLIQYARDTSTINFNQNDFNLRSFNQFRTMTYDKIILRNIPAAIILAPGNGSYHNPFAAMSNLKEYDSSSYVVREIKLTPSFDVKNRVLVGPPLPPSNTFNTLGTPYFGLYEKVFDQSYHGNIYTYDPSSSEFSMNYYTNGMYMQDQPPVEYRTPSIESKLIKDLVSKLASLSGVEYLTWWDIYRRLNTNELGQLTYTNCREILYKLSTGFVNGIKIYNVLSSYLTNPTGIPQDTEVPNDTIIINSDNRVYNVNN